MYVASYICTENLSALLQSDLTVQPWRTFLGNFQQTKFYLPQFSKVPQAVFLHRLQGKPLKYKRYFGKRSLRGGRGVNSKPLKLLFFNVLCVFGCSELIKFCNVLILLKKKSLNCWGFLMAVLSWMVGVQSF